VVTHGGPNKEDPYPSQGIDVWRGEVKGLQPTNTRVVKGACARTCGSKLLKVLVGSQRSRFGLRRIRTILRGSWPEGRGLHQVVSEHRKSSFLSVAEKRGTFYSHAAEKKRQGDA
jgi:hypothetical protein